MADIPTQRAPEPDLYRPWEQDGFGDDTVIDLGDGISTTLRELLEIPEEDRDDE